MYYGQVRYAATRSDAPRSGHRAGGIRADRAAAAKPVGHGIRRAPPHERSHMASVTDQVAAQDNSDLEEVVLLLEGVESARRMRNASDERLGITRHQFDVPVRSLSDLTIYSGANPRKNPQVRSRVAKQIRE